MHNGPVVTQATVQQIEMINIYEKQVGCAPRKWPKLNNLPGECVLVIFERCAHNCGEPYERRYTAIPNKTWLIKPDGCHFWIDKDQVIDFLDCNGRYYFKLPKGSWEFVKDRWFPRRRLHYDY